MMERIEIYNGSMAGPAAGMVSVLSEEIWVTLSKLKDDHYDNRRAYLELSHAFNRLAQFLTHERQIREAHITCDETTNPPAMLKEGRLRFMVRCRGSLAPLEHWGGTFTVWRDDVTRTLCIDHQGH